MTPRIRQTLYQLGLIATSGVTIAAIWHGIDGGTATALGNAITAVLGMLGVGATATAGAAVTKQRKDGTLDHLSPVEQAINGIQATVDQVNAASADLDRVKTAVSDVLGTVPVVGPLAQQVIASVKLP